MLLAVAALATAVYLTLKMALAVAVFVKAMRYAETVSADDPVVRTRVSAYRAEQERARRNYLSDLAEKASGAPYNMQGEERLAAEKVGQAVSKFSDEVIAAEIESRRKFKLGLFAVATGLFSKQ